MRRLLNINRKYLIIPIGLLLSLPSLAASVDIYQDMESGSSGNTLSGSIVSGGSHGSGGSWSTMGAVTVSTAKETPLRGPITVGGTVYDDAGSSRCWRVPDNVDGARVTFTPSSGKSSIVVSCYITIGPGKGMYELYDYIHVRLGGSGAVAQLNSGTSSDLNFNIESYSPTTHSSYFSVNQNQTYWVTFKVTQGGNAELYVYEISGWTVVGHVTRSVVNSAISSIAFGVGSDHGNSSPTYTYFDDICISWTDTTFPFLPAASGATQTAPTITTQPANKTVTEGQTASFSAAANGSPTPTYQWQKNTGSAWANISGATSSSYTTPATTTGDSGTQFRCVASNSAGSANSSAATLTVNAVPQTAPSFTSQPSSQTVTEGQTASFSAAASGNPTPTYQWQKNTGSGWANISGATAATYTTPATVATESGTQFRSVASNSAGSATSSAVTLTVNPEQQNVKSGIFPAGNAPTDVWSVAGVPGGIPNRTTVYTTLNAGASASQIQNAINGCPAGQVVMLGEGTFNIANITIGVKDNWVLRGSGMGKTILKITSTGSASFTIGGGPPWDGSWQNTVNITAGGGQGETNITVSSASGYSVGDMCVIDQNNTDWIVGYGTGGGTSATMNSDAAGKNRDGNRVQNHYCRIIAKSGNTLTFWPPLPYALESSRSPQITELGDLGNGAYYRGPQWSGLENMTINCNGTSARGLQIIGTYAFWLKNVEIINWGGLAAAWVRKSACLEVRGCYIHDPSTYSVDHGYGLQLDPVSGSLIMDNIIYNCQSTFLLQGGCDGNVIAYNVLAFGKYVNGGYTGEWLQHEINGNHTPFPSYNLFEGNYTGKFQADYYYGPSGWGMVFRNRIPGNSATTTQNRYAVSIDAFQRNYSVVGNQLGERTAPSSITLALPGVTRNYTQPGNISWGYDPGSANFGSAYIYRLGYPYSGNNGSSSGTAVHDSVVKTGTLRHGNWDAANNGVVWDSSISDHTVPDSLFLNSKPSWFGNLAWPPYGPTAPTSVASDLAKIPAGYRLLNNANPPATGGNQPPVASASASVQSGTAPLAVSFSSAGSSDPEGATLTYSWTFGDGGTSTSANPSHTYTAAGNYVAKLTVSDGVNNATSANINITATAPVNLPPVVAASASVLNGTAPLAVSFSSAGSSDPEGTTLTYSWTFGDGGTSTAANPSHTYSTAGNYVAKLTVSDGVNSTTSANINITATVPGNQPPVVAASASTLNGVVPLAVNFSNAGSSDPEGTTLTYSWTFGDGGTSTAANPTHTYTAAGNYVAKLTVSDGVNSTTSANINITATVPVNLPPVAAASASVQFGAPPLLVNFSSAGSSDPEGTNLTYSWVFGDGATSTAPNPSHTYQTAGNYVARLTVSDGVNSVQSSPIDIAVVVPGSGLVAAYGFEEGAGTTTDDSSGNNNNGTLSGGTWATQGKFGGALSFNGVSDLVVINSSSSLNLSSAMTLEAWVYPTATQNTWTTILHKQTDAYYLHVSSPAGAMIPAGGATYGGTESYVAGTSAVPLNAWTHLAVTYDGAMMRFYVNGSQVATQAQTGTIQVTSNPLRIGGNVPYGQYFQGAIDEVRIYNRAISPAEIVSDMTTPVTTPTVKPPSPVLHPIDPNE